jgi:hypothetical protein
MFLVYDKHIDLEKIVLNSKIPVEL